ncbi:chemotaxis protein CheW [Thermosulfuriphilus sp.]
MAEGQRLKRAAGQLVVFSLGPEEFGLEITSVREIVRPQKITPVPLTPSYILGLSNLRGQIIPVIDMRLRLGLKTRSIDERSRLLVISFNGDLVGLLVDEVKEVFSFEEKLLEDPPALGQRGQELVLKVVKRPEGRMILLFNLAGLFEGLSVQDRSLSLGQKGGGPEEGLPRMQGAEKRLLSFLVGREEYAFEIEEIGEIIRYRRPKEVPEAPGALLGILNLDRGVVPVFDFRRLLGLDPLINERKQKIAHLKRVFEKWLSEFKQALESQGTLSELAPEDCLLGQWLTRELESCHSETQLEHIHQLHLRHRRLHRLAQKALEDPSDDLIDEIYLLAGQIRDLFDRLETQLEKAISEEQRIIILEVSGHRVGLVVDRVQEVVAVFEETLEKGNLEGDLKAIAKFKDSSRIIFVIDKERLIPTETLEEGQKEEGMLSQGEVCDLEEEQLVTFFLGEEEYGFPITQIQEINRLGEISRVPKTPSFVEGVTNLRGEVIPVIDLRKRFEIPARELDDRTRLIIVHISGQKAGLIVDWVNEVTRLPKESITSPPTMLSCQIDLRFISGIAQREDGQIIIILDVNEILSPEEQKDLRQMSSEQEPPAPQLKIVE